MTSMQDVINPITITNYERDFVDGVCQHNPVFKLLTEKGNIKRNVGGTSLTWELKAGRHDVHVVDDYEDVSARYTPRKRFVQPTLSWGEVAAFRAISKGQLRQNSGVEALVRMRDEEIPDMFKDLITANNGLGHQFLNQDGTSYSGTGRPMYGLPSLFTSVTGSAGAKEGTVAGTYAGLPMASGALSVDGGEADAWTPTVVNSSSTAWAGGATNTFRQNCFEILTYAIARGSRFSSNDQKQMPDLGLLAQSMFIDLGFQIQAKQTIMLTGKVGKGNEMGIGYGNDKMLYHNGLAFTWDENMPANVGYVLNFSQIDLCQQPLITVSADKSPLKADGEYAPFFETEVAYNDGRRALTVSASFPGQFRFRSPRHQVQIKPVA